MPTNLLIAYGIFCVVPVGMAVAFALRRRAIERRCHTDLLPPVE